MLIADVLSGEGNIVIWTLRIKYDPISISCMACWKLLLWRCFHSIETGQTVNWSDLNVSISIVFQHSVRGGRWSREGEGIERGPQHNRCICRLHQHSLAAENAAGEPSVVQIGKKWTDSFLQTYCLPSRGILWVIPQEFTFLLGLQGSKGRPDQQIPQICVAVRFPFPTQKCTRTHCMFAQPTVASFQGFPLSGKTSQVLSLW